MMLLLDPTPLARGLVGKKVEVVNYPDGRFAVQFNQTALDFKVFDKIQTVSPGAIVDNKRLSAVLEQIKAQQAVYPARQQRGHVARQRPPNNRGAGSAVKGAGTAPRCRRSSGLIATAASLVFPPLYFLPCISSLVFPPLYFLPCISSLVFRYVTKFSCQTGDHRAVVRVGF
jgi:hypothetical protein